MGAAVETVDVLSDVESAAVGTVDVLSEVEGAAVGTVDELSDVEGAVVVSSSDEVKTGAGVGSVVGATTYPQVLSTQDPAQQS